jgi:repressor of nif and glnA expression
LNSKNLQTMESTISNKQVELLIEMIEDKIFMFDFNMKKYNIDYVADISELESLKALFKLALES